MWTFLFNPCLKLLFWRMEHIVQHASNLNRGNGAWTIHGFFWGQKEIQYNVVVNSFLYASFWGLAWGTKMMNSFVGQLSRGCMYSRVQQFWPFLTKCKWMQQGILRLINKIHFVFVWSRFVGKKNFVAKSSTPVS